MEISPVAPSGSLEAVYAALAEIAAAEALGSAATGLDGHIATGQAAPTLGAGAAVDHGPQAATAESDAQHPDARIDKGAETALAQSFARPASNVHEAPRPSEAALSAPAVGGTDYALPADQLVNAAVIGLAIEPSYGWPTQRRTDLPAVPAPRADEPRPGVPDPTDEHDAPAHEDHAAEPEHAGVAPRSGVSAEPDPADDWSAALSQALQARLRGAAAPRALLAAFEQWKLGRCVVLACPQGSDPGGAAWAHVLWPRAGWKPGHLLKLYGLRVEARVSWSRLPPAVAWCHARVMKEQHPRQGRQLVALDGKGTATVDCEVQLGPVPLRTPRWREACVRVDAVRRFWAALGEQWSVTVVVASAPLTLAREAAC